MKRLVLVGGGHAHLSVLNALMQEKLRDIEVIMITPTSHQNYSGMLPGWMAGHYTKSQVQINLLPLLEVANVKLIIESVAGIDAERRCVGLADGRHIEYDLLSIDVGSEINSSWLEMAGDKLLPVKPLDVFFETWPRILAAAHERPGYRLVVVGGGAAGIELALAAYYAFNRANNQGRVELVVSDSGVLAGHAARVQERMKRFLSTTGIIVHHMRAVGTEQGVMLSDGTSLAADCVIAATGARAPVWLKLSKLVLDENGYIAVDQHHRSQSHKDVFAAGDVCARQDMPVARSGVHAVHAGPVLAKNLLATLGNTPLTIYQPRPRSLYLLACGAQYAIASWGNFSAEGRWVWRWKDRIDRGFIQRFSKQGRQRLSVSTKEIA